MIKLDSSRINYASTQSLGQDLRFSDDLGNLLSFEIEKFDPVGTSIIWVKIPTLVALPSRTSLWMYYGNTSAIDGQNKTGVWDSFHSGIWHLNGDALDSTSNLKNGVINSVSFTPGLTGQAAFNSGTTGNNIKLPDSLTSSNIFTVSAMFKTATNGIILGHTIVAYPAAPSSYDPLLYVGVDGKLRGQDFTGSFATYISPNPVNDNQWHQVNLSGNTNVQKLYLDGQLLGSHNGTIAMATMINTYIGLGYWNTWPSGGAGWNSFNGTIDEVRISTISRSDDWILANYNSSFDLMSTYRNEENKTSGVAAIQVNLNNSSSASVTIPYTVTGTTTIGVDHNLVNGSLVIPPGNSSGLITPRIFRDNIVEGDETLIVTLGTPTGAELGVNSVHTIMISDEVLVAPVANNDNYNITSLAAMSLPVLSNDTDANGDSLSITGFSTPSNGTLIATGNNLLYIPSGDFGATDSFTYTISDGRGGNATATVNLNYQIPYTWIGSGANANWSTTANWLGGVAPGINTIVYFNNQCTTFCNPIISANLSVGGVRLNSSYNGIFTQPNGFTITLSEGWIQRAGTFVGGNSSFTMGSLGSGLSKTNGFQFSGGSFTSTSGFLTVNQGDFVITNSPAWNANGGTVRFGCSHNLTCNIIPKTLIFNNVNFEGYYSSFDLGVSTLTVNGNLSIGDTYGGSYNSQPINNGTINVLGNVNVINTGYKGTTNVRVIGNPAGQTITGLAGKYMPGLTIAAGVNDVTMVGEVGVSSNYIFTSAGIFTTPTTLNLFCGYAFTCNISPGTANYNNVIFRGAYTTYNLGGATMSILSDLTMGDIYSSGYNSQPINNGTLNVNGNVYVDNNGYKGTALLNYLGGNTTLNQIAIAGILAGNMTVNKTLVTNSLTLSSIVSLTNPGQNLTVTKGILDLAGFNLSVNSLLTLSSTGKILCHGGLLTAGSFSIAGEISCGTSAGISWTGAAGDNLWSTAGNWSNNNIPGVGDIALFGSQCAGANCNVSINSSVSVRGIKIQSDFTGTITQGVGNTITTAAAGWNQAAGTFVGSNADISSNGSFILSGGNFTSTSGTLNLLTNFTVSGAPTFTHNSGTLNFNGPNQNYTIDPLTLNFNNVSFRGNNTTYALTGTMNVNGTLTVANVYSSSGAINGGTILALGNVVFDNYGYLGSVLLKIAGNTNQDITGISTANIPAFEIASSGGTVSVSGTLRFTANYTYTSGTVDASTSSFEFFGANVGRTLKPGTVLYNNVKFAGSSGSYNLFASTMSVLGTLTIANSYSGSGLLDNGTILAKGNLSFENTGYLGSALIKVAGSTNQTLTGVSTANVQKLEIASTGGIVTLVGTISCMNNYTFTSGVIDATTSTLSFYNNFSTQTITPGPAAYYNVTFSGYAAIQTLIGTMTVNGTLIFNSNTSSPRSTLNTGTILAYGNITSTGTTGYLGTGNIKVMGSTNQTISGTSASLLPNLEIASTAGAVTYSGAININGNYTYTSGVVDASTSDVIFSRNGSAVTITPGTTAFNNVTFDSYNSTQNLVGTLTVNGTLNFNGTSGSPPPNLNSGAINANGNVTFTGFGFSGTVDLNFVGATSKNLSTTIGQYTLTHPFVVNKTGGASLILSNDLTLATGQNLTLTSGTLDLNTYDLKVNTVLTVDTGTTLVCNGGVFTQGTLVNNGTINCPGFSGYAYNWTGAAGDSSFSNPANWSGAVAPTNTSTVSFKNSFCGANCNVNLDTNVNIFGLQMLSPYTGTITQGNANTITIGAGGWRQNAGAFVGSNSNTTFNGKFALTAGSYTATSATTLVKAKWSISGAPTFTHNNGTIQINSVTDEAKQIIPGNINYYNAQFTGGGSYSSMDLNNGTMNVLGTLTINYLNPIYNGTISTKGDVNVLSSYFNGNAVTKISGSSNQAITVTGATSDLPGLEFASTGGVVSISGTLAVYHTFTYTSGNINWGTSTLSLGTNSSTNIQIIPGNITYGNVSLIGGGSYAGHYFNSGTMKIGGLLTINNNDGDGMNNGTLNVTGDLNMIANNTANLAITFTGPAPQSITQSGGSWTTGTRTVNKSAGTITQASAVTIAGANPLTITSGSWNMAGFPLTIPGLALNSNTLTKNAGILTVNSTVVGTGALYGGTINP